MLQAALGDEVHLRGSRRSGRFDKTGQGSQLQPEDARRPGSRRGPWRRRADFPSMSCIAAHHRAPRCSPRASLGRRAGGEGRRPGPHPARTAGWPDRALLTSRCRSAGSLDRGWRHPDPVRHDPIACKPPARPAEVTSVRRQPAACCCIPRPCCCSGPCWPRPRSSRAAGQYRNRQHDLHGQRAGPADRRFDNAPDRQRASRRTRTTTTSGKRPMG